ncbi:MAG: hypothetical protein RR178_05225 [Gordonibacter sp.]
MIEAIINAQMEALWIPYQYWEYADVGEGIPDVYFVGENIEDPVAQEDGRVSGLFVLSGWSYRGLAPLQEHQKAIKRRFMEPQRVATGDGAAVVEYSHASGIPSDIEGLCRLEINLNYYEWSVK